MFRLPLNERGFVISEEAIASFLLVADGELLAKNAEKAGGSRVYLGIKNALSSALFISAWWILYCRVELLYNNTEVNCT